jgi:SAM-dependent methyltransferase
MKDYVDQIFPGTHHTWYVNVLIPWIIKKYGIKPGSKVLDVGCGNGDCVEAFRKNGMRAIGVDRHKNPGRLSIVADIEKRLPFKARTFDFAFNKSVIEHVRRPDKMVDAVHRVLKKGGKFLILSPDWGYCYRSFYSDPTHYTPAQYTGLATLLNLHGFGRMTKTLLRPSGILMRHPRWRWLLIALTYITPYWWLGPLRFASRKHFMSEVCEVKE